MIGDRVVVTSKIPQNDEYCGASDIVPGDTGTILGFGADDHVHVEWSRKVAFGYSIGKGCAPGCGWGVCEKYISLCDDSIDASDKVIDIMELI